MQHEMQHKKETAFGLVCKGFIPADLFHVNCFGVAVNQYAPRSGRQFLCFCYMRYPFLFQGIKILENLKYLKFSGRNGTIQVRLMVAPCSPIYTFAPVAAGAFVFII